MNICNSLYRLDSILRFLAMAELKLARLCSSGLTKTFIIFLLCSTAFSMNAVGQKQIKFAIASDFHAPDVPDGAERLKAFVDAATREKVDFMIELGDFCRLDDRSLPFRNIWASFQGKSYHVIGNHDMDQYVVDEYVKGMGMPARYYSFDVGDFHFIVLDGNNMYDGKQYTHYARANYYQQWWKRAYIDPEQMEWLRRDLMATNKRCILFSHQSINRSLNNGIAVRNLLDDENRRCGFHKVVMAFSGHDHSNYVDVINDITYVQMNSASYVWVGKPTGTEKRYPAEVNKKYSLLANSITYTKPLYGIVTLNSKGAVMKGQKAEFMPPTPQELHLGKYLGIFPLLSTVPDLKIKFKK